VEAKADRFCDSPPGHKEIISRRQIKILIPCPLFRWCLFLANLSCCSVC